MQYLKMLQTYQKTENSREKLGKDCRPGCACNHHMQRKDKEKIQENIQNRGKYQEIKRRFAVT